MGGLTLVALLLGLTLVIWPPTIGKKKYEIEIPIKEETKELETYQVHEIKLIKQI